MFRSVLARAGVALSLSTIVLGALAAPTSAAVHTRWVDDDHTAGDGPTACDTATFHTIQGAINASHAGDKVFVCPGTYPEQLDITVPNLTVQANPTRTAKIVEPAAVAGPVQVAIESDGVKFTGFRISVPASSTDSADSANCGSLEAAIFATGQNEEITSNTIKATGDDTLSGDCGYYYGIIVATMTESSGGVYGPDTSYIAHNRVVDFKEGGILVAGDRSARIYSNNVRFVHQNDPATCLLTPVLGVQPTENLLFPCSEPLAVNPPAIMGEVPIFQGVGIGSIMALADIRANTVYSIFDLAVCEAGPCTAFLGEGVATFAATPGSIVRNNTVTNSFLGVSISDTSFFGSGAAKANAPSLPTAPGGVQVTGNRTNEGFVGVYVDGSSSVYYGNRSHLNIYGDIADVGGNVFDSNDFRTNFEYDCDDETAGGTGTNGTDNDWSAPNFGNYNNPSDICISFGP